MQHRKNFARGNSFLFFSVLLLVAFTGLLACGTSSKPSRPANTSSGINESGSKARAGLSGWELEWDNISSEARKEGRVVIYTGVANEMHQDVARAFRSKYREIEVEFLAGRTPELVQRHLTQQSGIIYNRPLCRKRLYHPSDKGKACRGDYTPGAFPDFT